MLVKKDEQSPGHGRYNIVLGAVVWGAVLALATYLAVRDGADGGGREIDDRDDSS